MEKYFDFKVGKFLSDKGLTMSEAQSLSNRLNQFASEIGRKLNSYNNYGSRVTYGENSLVMTEPYPINNDVVVLLTEKGELHALQAYLMEAIKFKNKILNDVKNMRFELVAELPEQPENYVELEYNLLKEVDESFGWDSLTPSEMVEYYTNEAKAAHYGSFIHKDGKLDTLRKELPKIVKLDWFEVKKDEKTPVIKEVHHTSEELLKLHDEISKLHHNCEKRVNYFKAKVKNLVTLENARIATVNSEEINRVNEINSQNRNEYNKKYSEYVGKLNKVRSDFEKSRNEYTKYVSGLRIKVPNEFQELINKF
jgi:hypothetical protein